MKAAHVNFFAALISLAASLAWLLIGEVLSGMVWFAVSLVWLAVGLGRLRTEELDPRPVRTIARKLSRLLMFG